MTARGAEEQRRRLPPPTHLRSATGAPVANADNPWRMLPTHSHIRSRSREPLHRGFCHHTRRCHNAGPASRCSERLGLWFSKRTANEGPDSRRGRNQIPGVPSANAFANQRAHRPSFHWTPTHLNGPTIHSVARAGQGAVRLRIRTFRPSVPQVAFLVSAGDLPLTSMNTGRPCRPHATQPHLLGGWAQQWAQRRPKPPVPRQCARADSASDLTLLPCDGRVSNLLAEPPSVGRCRPCRTAVTCGFTGGQGRGRTADLPIFSRTLVPTELPGRDMHARRPGGAEARWTVATAR